MTIDLDYIKQEERRFFPKTKLRVGPALQILHENDFCSVCHHIHCQCKENTDVRESK